MTVFRLTDDLIFPPAQMADDDGLLAVGGDLGVERLLLAYRMGIFPWYSAGQPILWWSPDPRLVLFLDAFHVSRRLRRVIRTGRFSVSFDAAFDEVIAQCSAVRGKGREDTWITPEMRDAYRGLHKAGYAHSVESWREGRLVGGLYGVSIGKCFFGESMFSHESNASKVALAALVDRLKQWEFPFIDCQVITQHLLSLGACTMTRDRFLELLADNIPHPTRREPWPLGILGQRRS